ncbi:hypothetical protein ABB37_09453 [Leptomonas pyrrhocoris]|uniref:Uncharacterized protein n=1 Tax=Leptomonas pyrrhocoris TaxID=157538 RepID=A0A0M9FQX6_LEPPY|nr:hypothetical protein ABB37_09453 [Leptomonas pyrrhocoris]KPA74197.1 hypothetical protein ABB37_09453 [Leptomonas pyrrhocoris]|eukprot:XP_015652636.1 hypothetical protein ABB37_09453 [Leptomonas pyrrhocoris]
MMTAGETKEALYATGISDADNTTAGPWALGHLTFRSLTDEYHLFTSEGTVGWVGLQVHLRRHTQSTQITALDLTCYRMQRTQWTWFALEILPQLQLLEVLRLVQMGLADDEVVELVRGSCGVCSFASNPRASPSPSALRSVHASPRSGAAAAATANTRTTPLHFLRVLDLSGNAISQRSCNHLGKMLLWMADSLEEVRLLGNPLKDYGIQTLAIYLSKLNVEAVDSDPELFPGTLRHQLRLARGQRHAAAALSQQLREETDGGAEEREKRTTANNIESLPIGPVLLDLRDCRASARGLSDALAAASRAHRLRVVLLSHNVAGVTALLPLPPTAYQEALDMGSQEMATAAAAAPAEASGRSHTYRPAPAPRRLRLAKTPLISSGALMRRPHAAFSDVRGFATSCALSTLVLHSVPLSQSCSPVGCRELLLNIFFSCPQLDLVDLSDTFEWSLVPAEEQQRLVAEANRRAAVERRLRGPEGQRGLQMYREDRGEVEFVLDTATAAGQTLLGDVCGELMAHAAYNAVVRQRVVPAAFAHVRELDLSNTGLTDAGARGLCVSVRRGRLRTGMLANLRTLNLSDNLLTAEGCLRVVSAFLLAETEDGEGGGNKGVARVSIPIAQMATLALQRNAGVEDDEGDFDKANGYVANGTNEGEGRVPSSQTREANAYLNEVCTVAEAAVLRRAALRSAAHGSAKDDVSSLTVYFSAPPMSTLGSSGGRSTPAARCRSSPFSQNGSARVNVYYAGCDERGDVFCTCPRSRLFVSEVEADRLMSTASDDGGASHLADQPPQRPPYSAAALSSPAATATTVVAGGGGVILGAIRTSPTSTSSSFTQPAAAQRSLLSSLDVPRTSSKALTRSQLQGRPGAGLLTTPDARLPPRPIPVAGAAFDEASGLVNSAPFYLSVNSYGDPVTSLSSFPPPSSLVMSHSSDSAAAAAHQQQVLQGPPQSQRGSLLSATGTSLGSLFLEKAERKGEEREAASSAGDAAATVDRADGAGAPRQVEDGEDERDNFSSPTARSAKRRAKARPSRVFVLSFDHPAGHLLCRTFNVLARPPPDPLGNGARAALAADLLSALQKASAQAASHPDNDGSNSTEDGMALSPRSAAIVVEAVKYLPPDLRTSDNRGLTDAAESHWMRFEVTTNERKARMAQRLQEVLNVPWADQCACFAHLLQWLRAHVVAEGSAEVAEKSAAATVTEWDPVQAVERAARLSPAVRAKLDALYAGSAVDAAHAHHLDAAEDYEEAAEGEAPQVASLAQLHPQLWKELGLMTAVETKEVDVINASTSQGQTVTPAATDHNPPAATTAAADSGEGEAGEDVHSAMSASDGTSRRQQKHGNNIETGKERHASPSGAAQQKIPVVDLYAGARNAEEQQPVDDTANISSRAGTVDKTAVDTRGNASTPSLRSLRQAERAATSNPFDAPHDSAGDAAATSTPLALEPSQGQGSTASVPTKIIPAESRSAVLLHTKVFRNSDELTDSGDDDDEEERETTSVETPEKQKRGHDRQRRGEGPSSRLSPPQSLVAKNEEGQTEKKRQQPTPGEPKSAPQRPPAGEGKDAENAVLTDQLSGPLSPADRLVPRRGAAAAALDEEEEKTPSMVEMEYEAAHVPAVGAPRPWTAPASNVPSRGEPDMAELRSSSNSPESRGKDGTRSDSTSSPGSRQQAQNTRGALASSPPPPVHAGKTVADGRGTVSDEGDEDRVVSSPVRVRRRSSELEGRVKTFTLSYTHQEGTAVCRAWRLLHAAVGGDDTAAAAERSPTSPSSTALAQEARDCLCDDFLALLQPPDEDRKHAVLSVTLHGDGGAATAMLQVQVRTNERRATLANRLQDSNHAVRRGGGSGGRAGIVPLTVDQVDRFYFPRLSRLLRRHKLAADTVAQMEKFLEARPGVQGRLIKSYGSIGSLVHYYHGSATALEHELGVSSWRELTHGNAVPTAAEAVAAASEAKWQAESASPTVAYDRVIPEREEVYRKGISAGADNRDGGNARRRGNGEAGDNGNTGGDGADTPRATSPSTTKSIGSNNDVKQHLVTPTQLLQGRPPPHPRRLPTPPHPLTHSSSISFDEVTEEPTSEAGPIVVLRGSTPSAAARSPSVPDAPNLQYYPQGHHTGAAESTKRARRGGGDDDSDLGVLSPMTSASASPSMARLTGASPPHTQQTLTGGPFMNALKDSNNNSSRQPPTRQREANPGVQSRTPTSPSPQPPPRMNPEPERAPSQQDRRAPEPSTASAANLSRQLSGSSTTAGGADRGKSEYERVLEGKYKRLMRVAYEGVARGSVPLEPQHQQKTVIGRGKWGAQKVELSLEWEILFVLTFEKSRTIGRSSRRAQMVVHPVGIGFECMSGEEASHQTGETSSLHSSMVNTITAEGSGVHPPSGTPASHASKGSRAKKEHSRSAASHLVITIQRPFSPNEVGSSSSEIEKTLTANALLTVSSPSTLSKAARLLGGGDDISNTSRGSVGAKQTPQEIVYQLCQRSLTLDIEMKSSKHVQEALRLLKNSIRRATQAVKKSMSNAHIPPPP